MPLTDTEFELCRDIEHVLKIGREFQKQDNWRGAHHDTAKLLCDTIEYLREQSNAQIGNAAKMREALKYLRDASREFCHLILNSKHNEMFDKYKHAEVAKIRDAIANAGIVLAAPPRNCDVGTEQEQQDRFREFCRHYESEGECGIGRSKAACPAFQGGRNPDCSLWWAHMPYEEGGTK